MISSHRSVPLWTAHSRGRSRNPFRSGGGAVLWGELHCGDGVDEGLCAGLVLCG